MRHLLVTLRKTHGMQDLLAVALLILLPFFVFWQVWAPNPADRIMFSGDILMGAYPTRTFVHMLFNNGTMPLWNPYQLGGMPILGDVQIAPFYTFNLLLDFLYRGTTIPYIAFEVMVIAHYALGAVLLFGYLRNLGVRPPAALIGAIAFEFNGFFVGHRGHYNMLAVVVWLPGVFWFFDRAWQAQSRQRILLWTVLAGVALNQLVMAGHPQLTFYCVLAIGGYFLYRWLGKIHQSGLMAWRAHLQIPFTFAVAGILAGGLAAIALLPVAELLTRSLRSTPTYDFAAQYSLLPRNLIGLLMPDFLGWGVTEYRIYAGILTMALAGIAWFVPNRSRPERLLFSLMALAGLVMALGGFTVLHGLTYRFVPGFDAVRVSARAFYFVNFALSVLAAFGAELLLNHLNDEERWRLQAIVRAMGITLAVALLLGTGLYVLLILDYQPVGEEFFFSENLFNRQPSPGVPYALLTQTANVYLLFILFLSATTVLLWLRVRQRIMGAPFIAALVLLMVLDVATYAPYHDTLKADPERAHFTIKNYTTELLEADWQVGDQEQLTATLQKLPPYVRVDNRDEVLPDNYSMVHRIAFATGYNILDLHQRFTLLTQWPYLPQHVRNDLLNIGYILTEPDQEETPEADAILRLRNSQGALWERAKQPAYLRFVTQIRPTASLLTVNGFLNLPASMINNQPTVAAPDENDMQAVRAAFATAWPEIVSPKLYMIGTSGMTSPTDLSVLAGGPIQYSAVIVDGLTVTPEQRGIVLALIDPENGTVISTHGFDTYLSTTESDRLAAILNAAPERTILALATYDEGFAQLNESARQAIATFGAATDLNNQFGKAYALIGVKGAATGTALEALDTAAVTLDVGSGAYRAPEDKTFRGEVLRYQPNQITLSVQNRQAGLLMINEAVYPGWVAYIDGEPTPILRANGLLRAIVLPPSTDNHPYQVTLVYAPLSTRLGGAITLFTLSIVGGLLLALVLSAMFQSMESTSPQAEAYSSSVGPI